MAAIQNSRKHSGVIDHFYKHVAGTAETAVLRMRFSITGAFSGVNREIPVGHLENDQSHAGRIILGKIAGPGTGCRLPADQLIADGGIPFRPPISAGEEHRLHGIIVAVVIVPFHFWIGEIGSRGRELGEIFQAARQIVAFKNTGVIKTGDAGGAA